MVRWKVIYLSPTSPPSSLRALHPKSLHVADGDDLGGVIAVVGNDSFLPSLLKMPYFVSAWRLELNLTGTTASKAEKRNL